MASPKTSNSKVGVFMVVMLSPNFSLNEMTRSDAATRLGIDNTPPDSAVGNLRDLCVHILEPLRHYLGKPILVSSGYRCLKLNHLLGGQEKSQHIYGQAADIRCPGISNDMVYSYIKDMLPFDQLIAEHLSVRDGARGWIHCSYTPNGRRDAISCVDGDYVEGLVYEVNE